MTESRAGRVRPVIVNRAPDRTTAPGIAEISVYICVMEERGDIPRDIAADKSAAAAQSAVLIREVARDDQVENSGAVNPMTGRNRERAIVCRSEVPANRDGADGIGA